MRVIWGRFFLALSLGLAGATGALAQGRGAVGGLDATLHEEVPPRAAIWVRPATGSPLHREIAARVAADLSARGYRMVQGRGHYVLSVRAASAVEFDLLRESWVRLEDNAVMVRPKLGGPSHPDYPTRPRILLAELHDADGNLAWSARAGLTLPHADRDELLGSLLPGLLTEMFTTVYDKAVPAAAR